MNRGFLIRTMFAFACIGIALIASVWQNNKLRAELHSMKESQLTIEIDIRGNEVIATASDGRRTVEIRRTVEMRRKFYEFSGVLPHSETPAMHKYPIVYARNDSLFLVVWSLTESERSLYGETSTLFIRKIVRDTLITEYR